MMPGNVANTGLYIGIFISLMFIDYFLGNGFIHMIQKSICKISCFVKRTIFETVELYKSEDPQIPVNISTFIIELMVLVVTQLVLEKFKQSRGTDRLDELINESKEALRLSDKFLEKWRMRRIPTETHYSYLDEEPQEIESLKLEVPIHHMAIIDTWSAARKQQERGDAGDSATYSDSAVISLVSLFEDDDDLIKRDDIQVENFDRNIELQNRCLWDVEEEDPNVEY